MAVESLNYKRLFVFLLLGTFFSACLSADYRSSTTSNLSQQRTKNSNSKSYIPSSSSYETLDEPHRHTNYLTTSSESTNSNGIRGRTGKYSTTEYPSTTHRRNTQSTTSTNKSRRRIDNSNRNSNEDIDELIRDTFSDEYLSRKEYSSSEYPVYISISEEGRSSRDSRNNEQRQSSQFADSFHGGSMLYISNRKEPVSVESFEREANRDEVYQGTQTSRKRGSQQQFSNESSDRKSSGSHSSDSNRRKTTIQNRNSISVDNCEFKICENDPNYPSERVLKLVKKNPDLQYYFNVEIQVDNRNMDDEEQLCRTKTITKFPQKAKNTRNEEKTIVNVDEYKQGFIMEYCEEENAKCKYADMFPLGRNPTCVQKFVTRRMMVVSEDENNGLVFDNFLIPSCCICTIKKQN